MTDRLVDLTASDPRHDRESASRIRAFALWLAGWTAFVVAMASIVTTQKGVPFRYAIRSEAVSYYSLALVSVVVWIASAWLARRGASRTVTAAAQVVLAVVLVAAWQGATYAYYWSMLGPNVWRFVYEGNWLFQLMNAVVLYGAVVAGTLALQASRRARDHERRQHELALLARDAELRALTMQLEPHFLLNTMNSVLALMETQPGEARAMLERLSEFLKAAFDEMQEGDVAFGRELDLIEAYLGIERVRFADRLRTSVDVPVEIRDLRVPPFLLQPLVENAIKHGIAPFTGPGSIAIRARKEQGGTRIEVSDSGPGLNGHSSNGRGLQLAERRLRAFAPGSALVIGRNADGRFAVTLTIPA
jgi:sensor histidine kinase YesM